MHAEFPCTVTISSFYDELDALLQFNCEICRTAEIGCTLSHGCQMGRTQRGNGTRCYTSDNVQSIMDAGNVFVLVLSQAYSNVLVMSHQLLDGTCSCCCMVYNTPFCTPNQHLFISIRHIAIDFVTLILVWKRGDHECVRG